MGFAKTQLVSVCVGLCMKYESPKKRHVDYFSWWTIVDILGALNNKISQY